MKKNLINFSLQSSGIARSYLSGVNQTIISVESNLIFLRNEISAEWINQKESNLKWLYSQAVEIISHNRKLL